MCKVLVGELPNICFLKSTSVLCVAWQFSVLLSISCKVWWQITEQMQKPLQFSLQAHKIQGYLDLQLLLNSDNHWVKCWKLRFSFHPLYPFSSKIFKITHFADPPINPALALLFCELHQPVNERTAVNWYLWVRCCSIWPHLKLDSIWNLALKRNSVCTTGSICSLKMTSYSFAAALCYHAEHLNELMTPSRCCCASARS